MIGTFYRRSAPDKDAFVEVGNSVGNGDVLCVIEAMKLFNEIESEVSRKNCQDPGRRQQPCGVRSAFVLG